MPSENKEQITTGINKTSRAQYFCGRKFTAATGTKPTTSPNVWDPKRLSGGWNAVLVIHPHSLTQLCIILRRAAVVGRYHKSKDVTGLNSRTEKVRGVWLKSSDLRLDVRSLVADDDERLKIKNSHIYYRNITSNLAEIRLAEVLNAEWKPTGRPNRAQARMRKGIHRKCSHTILDIRPNRTEIRLSEVLMNEWKPGQRTVVSTE